MAMRLEPKWSVSANCVLFPSIVTCGFRTVSSLSLARAHLLWEFTSEEWGEEGGWGFSSLFACSQIRGWMPTSDQWDVENCRAELLSECLPVQRLCSSDNDDSFPKMEMSNKLWCRRQLKAIILCLPSWCDPLRLLFWIHFILNKSS